MEAKTSGCSENWALKQVLAAGSVQVDQIKRWLQRAEQHRSKIKHFKKTEKIHSITWPKFTALQLWLTRTSSPHTHTHTMQLVHRNQSSTSHQAECVLHAVQQRLMMENTGCSFHLCPAQTFLTLITSQTCRGEHGLICPTCGSTSNLKAYLALTDVRL